MEGQCVNYELYYVIRENVCRFLQIRSEVLVEGRFVVGIKRGKSMELESED